MIRTEQGRTVNSSCEITRSPIIDVGDICTAPNSTIKFEEIFQVVNIETLSEDSKFMKYKPETPTEERIQASVIKAISIGMSNFRKQVMDPSLAEDGETIIYCAGKKPAVGKPAQWWEKNAPNVVPNKNSRQINELEKEVSLGVIINSLIEEEKYDIRDAYKKVLYYTNDATSEFGRTGRNPVGKWYDLNSTCKMVKKCEGLGHMIYGVKEGCGDKISFEDMANIMRPSNVYIFSTGEIVCDV